MHVLQVRVEAGELLRVAAPLDASQQLGRAFSLEVLPNRDALPYADMYGVNGDAKSFFRGTLRYRGWSELMEGFTRLGLTAPGVPRPPQASTWPELLTALDVPCTAAACSDPTEARAVAALHWLGAWEHDGGAGPAGDTVADALCALLASRLGYAPGERDAILMEHTMSVEYGGAAGEERPSRATVSSSLVGYGDAHGPSAMSKAVGLTAATGVRRVLESTGRGQSDTTTWAKLEGVLRPTEPSVYAYCLPLLAEEGLCFTESFVDA